MTKRVISLISMVLLIAVAAPVFADSSDWNFRIGSHLENTIMLDEDRAGDSQVNPALIFRAGYKNVYLQLEGENRTGASSDHIARQKVRVGGRTSFGALAFSPEYELRINTPVQGEYSDSNWENRFKLNFTGNFGDHRPYLNMMPTWKVNASSDDNYYHEMELGYRYMISGTQNVAFGIYNELNVNSDDTLHNELQARIYYTYTMDNGISVSPFARIGLYRTRNDVQDWRRDRAGFKLDYSAPNGLAPYGEMYWEGTEKSDYEQKIVVKMGASYSF